MSSAADQTRETPTLEPETGEAPTRGGEVMAGMVRVASDVILPGAVIVAALGIFVAPLVIGGWFWGVEGYAVVVCGYVALAVAGAVIIPTVFAVVAAYRAGLRDYHRHKVTKTRRTP